MSQMQMQLNYHCLITALLSATLSACSTAPTNTQISAANPAQTTATATAPAPATATATAPATVPAPKLVVLIVVDGLPMWQVDNYQNQFVADGFKRFLTRGATFGNAHYGYARTVTAAGHATVLTGAYPNRTGIIDNEWRDTDSWQMVYNTEDSAHTYIGHKTAPLSGTSPKNLMAESLGDVLKRASPQSKVIAISGKDRGAILPGGKAGVAYMYMSGTGEFASTTYYMANHPQWVTDYHASKPVNRYFGRQWKPLLADAEYKQSVPDGATWQVGGELAKLPMTFGSTAADAVPSQAFYANLLQSPFGDALTLDFARAAIKGEALGADNIPDILSVSLSSHDYINHAYGAESRLSHDHMLQLDVELARFFADLDNAVGSNNYVAVLTSDHGFAPTPEYAKSIGLDAGRTNLTFIGARLNAELEKKFGAGNWLQGWSSNMLVFNHKLLREKNINAAAMEMEASRLLRAEPEIIATLTRTELINGTVAGAAPYGEQIKNSFYAARSGDVAYVLKRNYFANTRTAGSTHGSPHSYDTHVPILLYGAPWVAAKRDANLAAPADIAPTLAAILNIAAPAQSQGKRLPLQGAQ